MEARSERRIGLVLRLGYRRVVVESKGANFLGGMDGGIAPPPNMNQRLCMNFELFLRSCKMNGIA